MRSLLVVLVCCFLFTVSAAASPRSGKEIKHDDEAQALSFLDEYDKEASARCYQSAIANWNYATNITDENEKVKLQASLDFAQFEKEAWLNMTGFFKNKNDYRSEDLRRKLKKLFILGSAALPEEELKEYNQLKSTMTKIYSTTKGCSFDDPNRCNLSLDPDFEDVMKNSRNEKELRHAWTEWHNKCGNEAMKQNYERFVVLSNKVATLNDFEDAGALWLEGYESDEFKDDIEELWKTLKPFYHQIHAYVRANLRKVYPDQFTEDGLIPAHLLGNMWAQTWDNIYSLMEPYPGKASIDVTEQMKKQGYTPLKMFQKSDEFFTSLGLIPMPKEFWDHSMIEKPTDREVVCHASAWDFCNRKDYRIKQCTLVSTEDLVTVHHEMGHIQYDLQYKDQPLIYRGGANPGFHEAVGDTLALSVQTPKHLKEIGLLEENTPIDDYQTTINFLFTVALKKIVFLPFGYIVDKYRWDIFEGKVNPSTYNAHWWKLRKEYQGLKPPSERTEDNFDASAKFHVPANVEYIRYFVSAVIQFQFHRSLCIEAGQYDANDPSKPLHNCDIYRSKEAGSKLAAGLMMGSSRPWPEAMKVMTGQEKMDASAIREYFKPLEDWLRVKNAEMGEKPGWA